VLSADVLNCTLARVGHIDATSTDTPKLHSYDAAKSRSSGPGQFAVLSLALPRAIRIWLSSG
jgi:hypothetical protein